MQLKNNFNFALLLSFIVHAVILVKYPSIILLPFPKKPETIKISYLKNPPQLTEIDKQMLNRKVPLVKLPTQVSAFDKKNLFPPANKENIITRSRPELPRDQAEIKPVVTRPDIIAVKKKITLPPVDMEKMNNPTYLNYYQFVREKIRRSAYQNYSRNEIGEVYLAFIISSNGILLEVRFIEEKSSTNYYLKETAMRSVRNSSPFPPFPKELDYPQLSFNVIISFEIE